MALRDFVDERSTVRHAGLVFVCGPPTVETVFVGSFAAVPEPETLGLLSIGALALVRRKRS